MDVRVCVEIIGLLYDENGNDVPAGIDGILTIEQECHLPYSEIVKSLNQTDVLTAFGLEDDLYRIKGFRFITPERFDEEYGESEYETVLL